MIGRGRQIKVFAYAAATDLRKGFDGLSALVSQELGMDPLSGGLFLFVSRNRIRAKVLVWDGTGLCVYAKRLEKGRFACLWERSEGGSVAMTSSELDLFLEGCKLVGKTRLSPPSFGVEKTCDARPGVRETPRALDRNGKQRRSPPASGSAASG